MRFSRRTLMSVAAAAPGCFLSDPAGAAGPAKIGFVEIGTYDDDCGNRPHSRIAGECAVERSLGDRVEISVVRADDDADDALRAVDAMARGHDMVFVSAFGTVNPTLKVARRYPKVKFEDLMGSQAADNVAVCGARFHEGSVVAGIIAGHMSQSGVVGYLAPKPTPTRLLAINAFALAMRAVNPNARLRLVWFDMVSNRANAKEELLAAGADLIGHHGQNQFSLWLADQFDESDSNRQPIAANVPLVTVTNVWGPYHVERVRACMAGNWQADRATRGLKDGAIRIEYDRANLHRYIIAAAEAIGSNVMAGRHHPFAGPLKDQNGAVMVPADSVLDDDMQVSMDWYVDGVQA